METETKEERNSLRERHTDLQRQRWRKTIGSLRERCYTDLETQRHRQRERKREGERLRARDLERKETEREEREVGIEMVRMRVSSG